jgi:FixJ family two-component response regulator
MAMRSRTFGAWRRYCVHDARHPCHETERVVFLVDEDDATRRELEQVLARDYATRTFVSVAAFFAALDPEAHGCIIVEPLLTDKHGVAFIERLGTLGCAQPVIFLSSSVSVPTTVAALRAGAINFLTKPVSASALLDAVRDAFRLEATRHEDARRRRMVNRRLAALTPREREVLRSLVSGKLNKQIAADLGIVENTVKAHRARIMQKLSVRSLAALVTFATTSIPETNGQRPLHQQLNRFK